MSGFLKYIPLLGFLIVSSFVHTFDKSVNAHRTPASQKSIRSDFPESEKKITITDSSGKTFTHTLEELLKHPLLETLSPGKYQTQHLTNHQVKDSSENRVNAQISSKGIKSHKLYWGLPETFKAIPLSVLFEGLSIDSSHVLQFECEDGFSAPLLPKTTDIALDPNSKVKNQSLAYIAIEEHGEDKENKEDSDDKKNAVKSLPWPDISKISKGRHQGTAGPFYLIWLNPEKSSIGPEEWPFKLKALKMVSSVEKTYPALVPAQSILDTHKTIKSGLNVFVKNCFACHTLNKAGISSKGPDLNFPQSPIEYFGRERLAKFIRNPKSVRYWPQGQMVSYSKESITEAELKALLDYLEYMSENRVQSLTKKPHIK